LIIVAAGDHFCLMGFGWSGELISATDLGATSIMIEVVSQTLAG
jgi:hypothetical protein